MADTTTIIAVIIPIVVVGGCLGGAFAFFKFFVISRKKPQRTIIPITYLPEIYHYKEEIEEFSRLPSKRRRRKIRLRRFLAQFTREQEENVRRKFDDLDLDDEYEEDTSGWCSRCCKRIGLFFTTGTCTLPPPPRKLKPWELEEGKGGEGNDGDGDDGDRPKRFVSQDRLDRQAARKLLIESQKKRVEEEVVIIEKKVEENTLSILDLETIKEEKIRSILDLKRSQREEIIKERLARGEVDTLKLNGGPSSDQVPAGYTVVEFIPDYSPERIVYKRILYLWETEKKYRPKGWFIGTIVGTSVQKGYNFNIKYDRAETKSIWIDGMQPVLLTFEGDSAYGRRWVIVEKIPDYQDPRLVAFA